MAPPKPDKIVPLHDATPGTEPASPPAFVFGSSYARVTPDFPIRTLASKPKAEETVVEGVDLSGKPKIIFLAGRGKTGKTTAIRWMSERALAAGRPLLMGDVDPGNISFGTYFQGVHEPPDRDSPTVAFGLAGGVRRPRYRAPANGGDRLGRRRYHAASAGR